MSTSEPAMPSSDGERQQDPRSEYLDGLLVRLQLADQMEQDTADKRNARRDEIENITSEYILNLLLDAASKNDALRAQLVDKGVLDEQGDPVIGTEVLAHLTTEIGRSMPTRLKGFTDGLVDTDGFNDGITRQLQNIVRNYQKPIDPYTDRRAAA